MNISEVIALEKSIEKKLIEKFDDPTLCNQYAWWILEAITNQKKEIFISGTALPLNQEQLKKLDDWMDKLLNKSMPLQYLLGTVPFLNLNILVEPPTLIPRPETEELCEQIIAELSQLNNQKLTILDIGTGSGCIALSMAKAFPYAQVYGVDIAPAALELAQKNADLNKIKNITFLHSDLFKNISSDLKFDLIISNPPYISENEWADLDDSVTQWEDRTALVANKKGLEIIERIVKNAPAFLKENKEMAKFNFAQLFIEIGYKQGQDVYNIFQKADFDPVTIKKDLEGKNRSVSGRMKNVAISKT